MHDEIVAQPIDVFSVYVVRKLSSILHPLQISSVELGCPLVVTAEQNGRFDRLPNEPKCDIIWVLWDLRMAFELH